MESDGMDLAIRSFLKESGWMEDVDAVSFLAAGEYNQNYLVHGPEGPRVLRVNHGSQLGLANQIAYEYRVLQAVEPSGVTPRPLACEPDPPQLDGGVLLMEYIPGRALRYDRDTDAAASIFARVHTRAAVQDGLVVQEQPVRDIAEECWGLVQRYPEHPLQEEKRLILDYYEQVLRLAEETESLFAREPLCLVNTEVNSGNFIIGPDRACLVDWEKAVLSQRYQDLGHFLVPTTTLWKGDHLYSRQEKEAFVARYRELAGLDQDLESMLEATRVMERTILLRALSWCFMAYYEYTSLDRAIKNPDTFAKIRQYLSDIPWILSSVT